MSWHFFVLAAFIVFFVKVSVRIRRGGGSIPYFISSGAMDATLDVDRRLVVRALDVVSDRADPEVATAEIQREQQK